MERLKNTQKIAVHWPVEPIKAELDKDICQYRMIQSFTVNRVSSMYVQQDWPYKKLFNFQ